MVVAILSTRYRLNCCSLFLIDDNNVLVSGEQLPFQNMDLGVEIQYIASADGHSAAIDIYGNLWIKGKNSCSELGLGDQEDRMIFTHIPLSIKVIDIAFGADHTVILDENERMWVCGGYEGSYTGELGLENINHVDNFTKIPGDSLFKSIFCDGNQTAAIDIDGKLWVCGWNYNGGLGLNNPQYLTKLTKINVNARFRSVSFGHTYIAILDEEGNLWMSGVGTEIFGLDRMNNLTKLNLNMKFMMISSGSFHLAGIDFDGDLWVAGLNMKGQLGLGDRVDRPYFTQVPSDIAFKDVSCFDQSTAAVSVNNVLWVSGDNYGRKLGFSDDSENFYGFHLEDTTGIKQLVNTKESAKNRNMLLNRFRTTKNANKF